MHTKTVSESSFPAAQASVALPQPLSTGSRFYRRLQRRYANEMPLLPAGEPCRDTMQQALGELKARGLETGAALRILRQMVMARLIELDCDQGAGLEVVTMAMTGLAELALDIAATQVFAELDELHGMPVNPQTGARVPMWIVGMGKLGARELNVSSDIDLIYVYDEDGETAGTAEGRGRISNQQYFERAIKGIYRLIGDVTEHGFVFRMDLALRPNGNSGPPVISLSALEVYLLVQGREWERLAWMKSRVVAPLAAVRGGEVQGLRQVVLPFVFRRYLDYNVFESLRVLHRQIREYAQKRMAGRPERTNDVKLSRGGIREIEFIVQLLQVVRGGQFPELRCRSTLQALQRLQHAGLMTPQTARALAEAYTFLRRAEHRIQYLDDQQTHALPADCQDLSWIAATMGYADTTAFLDQLWKHRELVTQEFAVLLGGGQNCPQGKCRSSLGQDAARDMEALLQSLPGELRLRLQELSQQPGFAALRDESRLRLMQLAQRTATWLREGKITELAAIRMVDWMKPLLRRESYLALLYERPPVHERLLHILGAAMWPVRYLLRHPGVIDELAGSALLAERFDAAAFGQEVALRREALSRTGEDDDEELLDLLRRAHHAEVFRTLARDVEHRLTVEQVGDDLSFLADSVLRITTAWCWERLRQRHCDAPQFAIIAYGKLGGLELGYGSDLDLVFVYEDDHARAGEIYAALVRKLITWLVTKTGEGELYDIDTALRPNGNSGLLVTSFDAYSSYQQQRGSNTAWTWEHQAITRARFVMGEGDPAQPQSLRERFNAVREAVISAPRDAQALRGEILGMARRVRDAHPVKAPWFDLKYSPGAMMDAEFAVQYLVLAQSARHPQLRGNVGNIALMQRAEEAGLLPSGVGMAAANAYRTLRQTQHRARLNDEPARVDLSTVQDERAAILQMYRAVFGETG